MTEKELKIKLENWDNLSRKEQIQLIIDLDHTWDKRIERLFKEIQCAFEREFPRMRK